MQFSSLRIRFSYRSAVVNDGMSREAPTEGADVRTVVHSGP